MFKVSKFHGALRWKGSLNSFFDAFKLDFICEFFTEHTFKLVLAEFMNNSILSETALTYTPRPPRPSINQPFYCSPFKNV